MLVRKFWPRKFSERILASLSSTSSRSSDALLWENNIHLNSRLPRQIRRLNHIASFSTLLLLLACLLAFLPCSLFYAVSAPHPRSVALQHCLHLVSFRCSTSSFSALLSLHLLLFLLPSSSSFLLGGRAGGRGVGLEKGESLFKSFIGEFISLSLFFDCHLSLGYSRDESPVRY